MKRKMMRFSCLVEKGVSEIRERSLGEINENQVLVKQLACNICTTDYGQWKGLREHQGYPHANGHEGAGIIIEKGEKVTELEVGDLVAMTYDGCEECEFCKRGDYGLCLRKKEKRTSDGYKGDFGFSDYLIRNANGFVKMNSKLDPSEAAFLEPLATVVSGIRKLRLKSKETVVVIGAGTMGILNAQVARVWGARVIISEIMEKKLKTAKALGFETIDSTSDDPIKKAKEMTNEKGPDCVIVAVGSTEANEQAVKIVKEMEGRILLFAAGYPVPKMQVDSNELHYRRLELLGTYLAKKEDFQFAGRLLSEYKVDVSRLIEKKFSFEDMQSAYKYACLPGMYRVSVLMNQ